MPPTHQYHQTIRLIHELSPELEALLVQILDQSRKLNKIQRSLDKIMSAQDDFNAQIQAANDKLDAIGTDVTNTQAAITAEAQQVADFIASQPAGVDTSALQGVVDRLGAAADSLGGTADAVGGIFTPPTPPEPAA